MHFCLYHLLLMFVSSQMADASPSESPEEEDNDSPAPGKETCSPPSTPRSPSTDNWLESPRKRTQTLPTFNCPLSGMAAKADALNRWSRIQESVEEKSGTLSEDIFKILDLRASGSFFGGSPVTTKEKEDGLKARRGSGNTSSPSAVSQKPNIDTSLPSPLQSDQVSSGSLPATRSVLQGDSTVEDKKELKDSQQLIDR